MVGFLRLSLLLIFLSISTAHTSDSDALRSLIADIGLRSQLLCHSVNHPCRTPGISCETRGSSLRATRVHLPSRRLNGSIPPSIGRLSELQQLSLPNNRLSGVIPREISGCRSLEILNLRNNRLSGVVPFEISSLISLRSIDLSSNRFTGDLQFLVQFPNLENLSLADNLFSGKIPQFLSSFRNLVFLDLSANPDLLGNIPRTVAESYLRRSLLPINDTNGGGKNSSRNSSRNSAAAPAPSPTPSIGRHRKAHKNRTRYGVIGFVAGSSSGIVSGLFLTVLFRFIKNCIRGMYKNPSGPSIFSPVIKKADDLAFLYKDDGLASLEVIGRGGCGEVYKGLLPYDPPKMIAIKKIMKRSPDGAEPTDEESKLLDRWMRQIRSEILTVGRIRHRNLLPLLAHFSRPDRHYLIYEFMKNGSLHDILKEVSDGSRELDWLARHKIAIGIASGLEYLHVHHTPHIIHRDLKPGNILLDDNMEARIADFGMAKEVPDANTHMTTSNVAGTVGYIAPEYYQTLKFTAKCDVYSFGVILAVLVMGRAPSDEFFQETDEMSLVKWLRNVMSSENPSLAIDPRLVGQYDSQMMLVLRIACFCTADDPKERPTSKEVRSMLAQIKH